jgi:hypothetical protein
MQMLWLVSVGGLTAVILLYWMLLDYVLDTFGSPRSGETRERRTP